MATALVSNAFFTYIPIHFTEYIGKACKQWDSCKSLISLKGDTIRKNLSKNKMIILILEEWVGVSHWKKGRCKF